MVQKKQSDNANQKNCGQGHSQGQCVLVGDWTNLDTEEMHFKKTCILFFWQQGGDGMVAVIDTHLYLSS